MTRQEMFDKAYRGVMSQGGPSVYSGFNYACRYRGAKGRKCAAGWLIPDEQYSSSMEGITADFLGIFTDAEFVNDLQGAHDMHAACSEESVFLQRYKEHMCTIALAYDLSPSVLDENLPLVEGA